MLGGHFGALPSVVVEPGVRTGIPVLTDNPREVGTDRIVNALAAATRYGGPAVVVDFGGTATTFDVVNSQGQYVGGAISPGIEISLEALERRGAQLRMVELRRPRIGDRPQHRRGAAVRNGLRRREPGRRNCRPDDRRARGSTRRSTCRSSRPAISRPWCYDECRCFTVHDPWLTLRGLELVYLRNT